MDAALAGILGTLVGSLLTQMIVAVNDRDKQMREDRRRWFDARREAYTSFIAASDRCLVQAGWLFEVRRYSESSSHDEPPSTLYDMLVNVSLDSEVFKETSSDYFASCRAAEKAFGEIEILGSLKALETAAPVMKYLNHLSSDLLRIGLATTSEGKRDIKALDPLLGRDYISIIDALQVVLMVFKNAARIDFGVTGVPGLRQNWFKRLWRRM
jgi:hypothetical protein